MTHDEAAAKIATACGYLVQDAIAGRLAIMVAKQCGISAAVAMQVTARQLAADMVSRTFGGRGAGKTTKHRTARALLALADTPSDQADLVDGTLRPELAALA